jgi:hypothetical protein
MLIKKQLRSANTIKFMPLEQSTFLAWHSLFLYIRLNLDYFIFGLKNVSNTLHKHRGPDGRSRNEFTAPCLTFGAPF